MNTLTAKFINPLQFVVLLTILLLSGEQPTIAQTTIGTVHALDEKYGFRDVKFGTPHSAFTGLVPKQSEGDRKMYQRKNESLYLGKYRFNNITYTFYKERLSAVICTVVGIDNLAGIEGALMRSYGPGKDTKTGKEWVGRRVKMQWMQWSDSQVFLTLESIPLLVERETADKRAIEKASSDL